MWIDTHIDADRVDTMLYWKCESFFLFLFKYQSNKKKLRPAYSMWKHTNNINMETHNFCWMIDTNLTQQNSMEFIVTPSVAPFANRLPTYNLFTCERAADWNAGEEKNKHQLKWQFDAFACIENLLNFGAFDSIWFDLICVYFFLEKKLSWKSLHFLLKSDRFLYDCVDNNEHG